MSSWCSQRYSAHTIDVCLKRQRWRLSRGASSLEPLIFDVPHQLIMCADCMLVCLILSDWITCFTATCFFFYFSLTGCHSKVLHMSCQVTSTFWWDPNSPDSWGHIHYLRMINDKGFLWYGGFIVTIHIQTVSGELNHGTLHLSIILMSDWIFWWSY